MFLISDKTFCLIHISLEIIPTLFELFSKEVRVKKQPGMSLNLRVVLFVVTLDMRIFMICDVINIAH